MINLFSACWFSGHVSCGIPQCLPQNSKGCISLLAARSTGKRSYQLIALLLLSVMSWMPVEAAQYMFPPQNIGDLPAGCAGSGGSYNCGALALAAGDKIIVNSPTTIFVAGALTAGRGSSINANGAASDLTLVVSGTTGVDAGSTIVANLMGVGAITLGASSVFTGKLTTDNAAISVGDFSTVNGSITTTVAGVITVGANSRVTGSISTLSGAVNVGANSRVDGFISSTLAGVVTIGAGTVVGGEIKTVSGAINLGAGSKVSGSVSDSIAGAITVGDNAVVGGSVSTNSGAITIGTGSRVSASVCTGLAGAITLNDNTDVGGNLSTNAGAITVGSLSKVAGTINAVVGAVTVAPSASIGTVASKLKCPYDPPTPVPPPAPAIKKREWRQLFMR